MIHDFCLQFSKKVAYSELTERILLFSKQWFVGREIFSDEQRKIMNKTNNKTKLDSRLANGFRQDTDTKVLLLHLSKMIDVS